MTLDKAGKLSRKDVRSVVIKQATRLENPQSAAFPGLVDTCMQAVKDVPWAGEAGLRKLRVTVRKVLKSQQKKMLKALSWHANFIANGNASLAEDLTQEAWLFALEQGAARPFKTAPVKGHMLTHLKQSISPTTVPTVVARQSSYRAEAFEAIEFTPDVAVVWNDPEQETLNVEAVCAIREAFHLLSDWDQKVIELSIIEQAPAHEIARELGISCDEAELACSAALEALREVWDRD